MHSGSTTALCLNKFWQGKHQNHTPTPKQRKIYGHFMACADYARQQRKGKRLIVVHDGDAIDGLHHGTQQVFTMNTEEQTEIHEDLMDTFLRRAKFNRKEGDKLFYVSGTEVHTGDSEDKIGKSMRSQKTEDGLYAFDHLEVEVNGRLVWFVHHGPKLGKGANEGNMMRNWLRDIYWTSQKYKTRPPDLVVTGHVHTPGYNTYVMDFHVVHGLILPSWQAKTRYGYMVAPTERNEIGAAFVEIKADGEIRVPFILKQETASRERVSV